jgi:hypothetical protein
METVGECGKDSCWCARDMLYVHVRGTRLGRGRVCQRGVGRGSWRKVSIVIRRGIVGLRHFSGISELLSRSRAPVPLYHIMPCHALHFHKAMHIRPHHHHHHHSPSECSSPIRVYRTLWHQLDLASTASGLVRQPHTPPGTFRTPRYTRGRWQEP